MKKIVSVFMCILMLFSVCSVAAAADAAERFSKGDVDGSGSITAADARLALRTSVKLEKLSLVAMTAADVNDDSNITAADARLILRASVGLESFSVPAKMPETKAEICDFYKKGVDEIKAGKAGYIKKEWQNVDAINIGGSTVNSLVTGVLGSFMTAEADASEQVCAAGSDEAKNRIAAWTLTDLSKVADAKCVKDGSNYRITIIMKDEDTPKKSGSVLGQVTNSLIYWEDLEYTLKNDSSVEKILTEYKDLHIVYKGFRIEAVMTPDGRFVSIDHTSDIDILIGYAKITVFTIENKSGHMWNYCKYYDFDYPGASSGNKPDDNKPVIPDTPVSGQMPVTTAEICNFYKSGIDKVRAGEAGYMKKEWQNVDYVNVGNAVVNNAVTNVLGNFMTQEADAFEQICDKGSEDAKRRIPEWTLTDLSEIASATCVKVGNNYKITIIMKDEDTPKKNGSVLGQVTNSVLFWEDIEATLTGDPTVNRILKEFRDMHIIYKGFTIEAVMTPEGEFVSLDHTADVDILIGYAKILTVEIKNKSGHMWNYCKYYNFEY